MSILQPRKVAVTVSSNGLCASILFQAHPEGARRIPVIGGSVGAAHPVRPADDADGQQHRPDRHAAGVEAVWGLDRPCVLGFIVQRPSREL